MAQALQGIQRVLVVEQSHSGQFYRMLRAFYELPRDTRALHRAGPLAFGPGQIWINSTAGVPDGSCTASIQAQGTTSPTSSPFVSRLRRLHRAQRSDARPGRTGLAAGERGRGIGYWVLIAHSGLHQRTVFMVCTAVRCRWPLA